MGSQEARPTVGAGSLGDAAGSGLLVPRHQPKITYLRVTDLAAEGIAVMLSCRVLGLSLQAYYK